MENIELSIVMPCLNEAETLAICIRKAHQGIADAHVVGEIVISDNGSTDGSQEIAQKEGARVVNAPQKGYGAALGYGITESRGKYVIMADSDDSYDLSDLKRFVDKLREGNDLVMGSRLNGKILSGAMPWLHRWIGNPILTFIANLLFGTHISDYHCGMRAFDRQAILNLNLQTSGMEFATEMVAQAALHKFKIAETPITYYPDGRSRPPHLRTWRDGWRHLSFMLLLSPTWTLLYPGLAMLLFGLVGAGLILPGPLYIGSLRLDVHTLLTCGMAIVMGSQLLAFWITARFFAASMKLLPNTRLTSAIARGFPLNTGLVVGVLLMIGGIFPIFQSLREWAQVEFGALNYEIALRWLISGLTLGALGVQIFFTSFVLSLLNFARKNDTA